MLFSTFSQINRLPISPDRYQNLLAIHQVDVFGVKVLEPSTVLSSLMMTVVCVFAWCRLKRVPDPSPALSRTKSFFLFMAMATAIGGILGHGLLYHTGMAGKLPGWFCGMLAVCSFERAMTLYTSPFLSPRLCRGLLILNYIVFGIFLSVTFFSGSFITVQLQAVYGLFLFTGGLALYNHQMQPNAVSRNLFWGLFFALLAAASHLSGINISRWFNANDLSHIPMAIAIACFYRAAVSMQVPISR